MQRLLIVVSILGLCCSTSFAQEPGSSPPPKTTTKKLSSVEIYDLLVLARAWRGDRSREAVVTLGASGSQEAFQGLVKVATDRSEVSELRWACLRSLAVSKSDQAGLYLIDCHKELRREFSQSRLMRRLTKALQGYLTASPAWATQLAAPLPALEEFRQTLKGLLTGKTGQDLAIVSLYAMKSHPYKQVLDYLTEVGRTGGSLERVAAAYSLTQLPNGLGLNAVLTVLQAAGTPEAARLAVYDVLAEGYVGLRGAAGALLRCLPFEKNPSLSLVLVRGAGRFAGREALPELDKALSVAPGVGVAHQWAVAEICKRNPSEWRWLIGLVTIIGVIGLTVLAINYLRMPPTVLEKLYLQDTGFCDLAVQLQECDMAQVLQAVVRVDPDCFVRFIRVSLLYEGAGEVAFRERSLCIANDAPYNFVGGGTIIDDWHWNQGRPNRVLANWYFDLQSYADARSIPIMLGVLFRGDDELPKVTLKIAGLRPDKAPAGAAVQDKSFTANVAGLQ